MRYSNPTLPQRAVADYCRRHHIQRLALFGSVLRDDFGPDSDVDIVVDFEQGHVPGLIALGRLERELWDLVGRRVDLHVTDALRPNVREAVAASSQVQYERR